MKIIKSLVFFYCVTNLVTGQELYWHKLANIPQPLMLSGSVLVNNYIYLIGGKTSENKSSLGITYRFNIQSNKWIELSELNDPRNGHSCVYLNDHIYILGNGEYIEEYDITNNIWLNQSTVLKGRDDLSCVAYQNMIYIIGGSATTTDGIWQVVSLTNKTDVYNPVTKELSPLADIPTKRKQISLALLDDDIYAIGGYAFSGSPFNVVEKYNITTNTWQILDTVPVPFIDKSCVYNGTIYITCSGFPEPDKTAILKYNVDEDKWIFIENSAPTLSNLSNFLCDNNGKFYLLGGTDNNFIDALDFVYEASNTDYTEINKIQVKPDLIMFPNPSKGEINFKTENYRQLENLKIQVFNTIGQLVYVSEGLSNKSIQLNHLKKGPYFICFSDIESTIKKMIIIE